MTEREVKAKEAVVKYFKAVAFLISADTKRFGHLIADFKLDMLKGHDNYPNMVNRDYSMLSEY